VIIFFELTRREGEMNMDSDMMMVKGGLVAALFFGIITEGGNNSILNMSAYPVLGTLAGISLSKGIDYLAIGKERRRIALEKSNEAMGYMKNFSSMPGVYPTCP
jgi:hypothetical protein